jgi:Rrf2 family protein
MFFSKTQEYAIQAIIHLALTPAVFRLNRDIAEHLGVPGPYLAKVLKRFAQSGYLDSAKGRGGGYRIRKRALIAPIREIMSVADDHDPFSGCVLGLQKCTDAAACPIHERWTGVREKMVGMLDGQTVADLAGKAKNGRTRLNHVAKKVAKPAVAKR